MRVLYRLVIIASCLTGPAIAHEHATGVVKERMDAMGDMAKRDKSISQRLKSNRDLASIKTDAEAIAAHAPHIVHLFPKGSLQQPTRARSAIWQNWPDFESKVKALEAAAKELAQTNQNDAAALRAASNAMVRTCDACHEKYRTGRR